MNKTVREKQIQNNLPLPRFIKCCCKYMCTNTCAYLYVAIEFYSVCTPLVCEIKLKII